MSQSDNKSLELEISDSDSNHYGTDIEAIKQSNQYSVNAERTTINTSSECENQNADFDPEVNNNSEEQVKTTSEVDILPLNTENQLLQQAEKKCRTHKRKNRNLDKFLLLVTRFRNDLRLDDYHKISWHERWKHFIWLLGFDRFPFRERGWVLLLFSTATLATIVWLADPTSWEFYRNWRAQDYLKRAEAAIESFQMKTAQIHLRNAYRHTPDNIEILKKWLETLPSGNSDERLGVLLEIFRKDPSGDTAAAFVEELLEKQNLTDAADFAARQLTLYPESGRLWLSAGKVFLMQKRFAVARDAFMRCKKLITNDKNIDFYIALIDILSTPLNQKTDYSVLESLASVPEVSNVVRRTLALLYSITDPQRADNIVKKIITENPSDEDFKSLSFRIRLGMLQNNITSELWEEIWNQANTLDQRLLIVSEAIRYNLPEVARNLMDKLSQEDRKMSQSIWTELLINIVSKEWQKVLQIALETFKLSHQSKEWQIRFLAAAILAHEKLGNTNESEILLNESIRYVRGNPMLSYQLSETLFRLNLYKHARDVFELTANMESPLKELANQRLLEIYKIWKDWDNTYKTLERLTILNPNNNSYVINFCSMLLIQGKINHPMIMSLLSTDNNRLSFDNYIMDIIAHAHARIGNLKRASQVLSKIESAEGTPEKVTIHRIATLAYLGRKEEAADKLTKLLKQQYIIHEREKKYLEELINLDIPLQEEKNSKVPQVTCSG